MQIEAFAIRLRVGSGMEAADLGVRLCQSAARSVWPCYAVVALPIFLIALLCIDVASWLPTLVLWWAKPWLDRSILFVLSRSAFGQSTSVRDLWRAQREVWWRQLLSTLTHRRLSPWRSFTQPAYQLEGKASLRARRKRVLQLRSGNTGTATLLTSAFGFAELALMLALLSLLVWFTPQDQGFQLENLVDGSLRSTGFDYLATVVYALVIFFLEPFYVAAGFGMYLNRRVQLEAWDIEQEFRRAFVQ